MNILSGADKYKEIDDFVNFKKWKTKEAIYYGDILYKYIKTVIRKKKKKEIPDKGF